MGVDYWLNRTGKVLETGGEKGLNPSALKNQIIAEKLLNFLKSHFLGSRDGHPDGILFNAADDDPAPPGVDSKLSALDVPGERDFFVAYFPGAVSIGLELYEGFDLLGQVFFLCLVDAGQFVC